MVANLIKNIFEDESGQGITEYGALLAFVALIVATVFSSGQSSLMVAVKNSFSGIANNINQLAGATS